MNISVKDILHVGMIALGLSVASCTQSGSNGTQQAAEAHSESADARFEDPKVETIFAQYVELKNSLVSSDAGKAQAAAGELQKALSGAGHEETAQLAQKIASSNALPEQRASLDSLTLEIEKVIKSARLSSGKIYKQHCPMANGGDGGSWFSLQKEIRNPYYGDDMLECGTVEEELH